MITFAIFRAAESFITCVGRRACEAYFDCLSALMVLFKTFFFLLVDSRRGVCFSQTLESSCSAGGCCCTQPMGDRCELIASRGTWSPL